MSSYSGNSMICSGLERDDSLDSWTIGKVNQWFVKTQCSTIQLCQLFWGYVNGLNDVADLKEMPNNFACPCCGLNLLHLAVAIGSAFYLEQFLNWNINVNAINDYGETALHMAAGKKDATIVDLLLRADADPNVLDNFGQTPLQVLLTLPSTANTTIIVDALFHQGARISRFFKGGNVDDLLEVNRHIGDGMTPLCKATNDNDVEEVRRLLDAGACPSLRYSYGTPLMCASFNGYGDVLRLLLDASVDVCQIDADKQSALSYAVLGGHHDLVMALLDCGVNPNLEDVCNHTALDVAVLKNRAAIVVSLLDHGAFFSYGEDLPFVALHRGAVDALAVLVQRDFVDVNQPSKGGESLYYLAKDYDENRFVRFVQDNFETSFDERRPTHGIAALRAAEFSSRDL